MYNVAMIYICLWTLVCIPSGKICIKIAPRALYTPLG